MLRIGEHRIKTPAICGSVLHEDLDSMKSGIDRALEMGADIIELRLDKLEDSRGLEDLLPESVPAIATNRTEREGGHFEGEEEDRIRFLLEAIEAGASCIDIELSTDRGLRNKVLKRAKEEGASTIISFHEFEKVPSIQDLMEKGRKMEKIGCDFGKIIGYSNNSEESINMLDFLIQSSENLEIPMIAFAMGKNGEFTRLASTLLGSPFTYASIGEKNAPGQLSISEVKEVLEKYRY